MKAENLAIHQVESYTSSKQREIRSWSSEFTHQPQKAILQHMAIAFYKKKKNFSGLAIPAPPPPPPPNVPIDK